MKSIRFIVLLFTLSLIACNGNSPKNEKDTSGTTKPTKKKNTAELLLGTWEYSLFLNNEQSRKTFEIEDDPSIEIEATMSGTDTFMRGNRYNSEGTMKAGFKANGMMLALEFHIKESGKWEIHDDYLVMITEDSKVTPLNEMTKAAIASDPQLKAELTPVKGESTSSKILDISSTFYRLELDDMPGVIITGNKKY
jgi:hypothetical protein